MGRKRKIPEEQRSKQLQYYYARKGEAHTELFREYRPKVKDPDTLTVDQIPLSHSGKSVQLRKLSGFHQYLMGRMYHKKSYCLKEGIEYSLSPEWVVAQLPYCAATGVRLSYWGKITPTTLSIDRIDPKKGYTVENVRLVAYWYNTCKRNWPDEEISERIIEAANYIRALRRKTR